MVLAVKVGGSVMPLRVSRYRAPETGASTEPTSAPRTRSLPRGGSASGPETVLPEVPIVESENGIPNNAAACAPATSPSTCIIRVRPVGAITDKNLLQFRLYYKNLAPRPGSQIVEPVLHSLPCAHPFCLHETARMARGPERSAFQGNHETSGAPYSFWPREA